jgi:peptide/nickel transport system substrate-binding protein
MFETLYTDRDINGVQPELATDLEISEDLLEYTFTLREGVVFHDGTPFNADAVVFNYMRYLDDTHEFYDPNVIFAKTIMPGVDEVVATGEFEVQFRLSTPTGTLVTALAQVFAGIMSPTAIRESGADEAGLNPVGTGRYSFVESEPGDHITLEGFADHWTGPAPLDRVVFRALPDQGTLLAAVLAGEIDITSNLAYKDITLMSENDEFRIHTVPGSATGYLPFNVGGTNGITDFTDIRVRKAALHAIDRQRIADNIFFGHANVAGGFLPDAHTEFYNPKVFDAYPYDPDRARELLEEAGVEPSLVLRSQSSGFWPTMAQMIQADMNAVGFDVSIEQLDTASFYGAITKGDQALWVGDAGHPNPDPFSTFAVLYGCENARNARWGGWCDAEFDRLMSEQSLTTDQDERRSAMWRIEEIFIEQAIQANLYYADNVWVISKNVENFNPSRISTMWLDETRFAD